MSIEIKKNEQGSECAYVDDQLIVRLELVLNTSENYNEKCCVFDTLVPSNNTGILPRDKVDLKGFAIASLMDNMNITSQKLEDARVALENAQERLEEAEDAAEKAKELVKKALR